MTKRTRVGSSACAVIMALAGCDPESDEIEGVQAPAGFAVTHSDYDMAGAIALLGPDGELEMERFVHSGTELDGLGSALSSDVVLPTTRGASGTLTYIERLGADLVTRIDIESGEVLGQIDAQREDAEAYRGNPYDCVHVDDGAAWITRNAPNPGVAGANGGNDLVMLDLAKNAITTRRVSFDRMNDIATVENVDTGEESAVEVFARPAGAVKLGKHAVVGLDRISLAYDAIAPGMIAIVDLEERSATGLDIPGMSNCGTVLPIPGDDTRVLVNCKGSFLATERDEAGYVIVKLDGEVAEIEHTWAAAVHEDDPMATYSPVSLGGTRVIGVEPGGSSASAPANDAAYVLDIESGEIEMLADSDGAYVLGASAYDAEQKLLLMPDASADADGVPSAGVRRFRWDDDGEVEELEVVVTDPDLAPRSVAGLY